MKILLAAVGTVLATFAVVAVAVAAVDEMGPRMGPTTRVVRPAFHGYYDGHKDTYLNLDVSDRAEATQMHINYAQRLKAVPLSALPEMYMVSGRAPAGQLAVFDAEPGEADYSPIWREVIVKWNAGETPTLLVKDDDIAQLVKQGKLTEHETDVRLNCPIIKVGGKS